MGFEQGAAAGWAVPEHRRRGRAALSNLASRFDAYAVEQVDDGWETGAEADLPPLRTEVALERPRSIITRNSSPDLSFDRSVNAYRGCEHVMCTEQWVGHTFDFTGYHQELLLSAGLISRLKNMFMK